MTEGNRWSVILAKTCFVHLQIVLKVFVCVVFFFSLQCTESNRDCFSVVLNNVSKGFSQAHVPGAFFTFLSHILLVLCCFLADCCISQLPLLTHAHTR